MSLKDFIPASWRRKVYFVFALVGLILTSVQVGVATAEIAQPLWLTVSFPVYALWATAVGFTAQGNTSDEHEVSVDTVQLSEATQAEIKKFAENDDN